MKEHPTIFSGDNPRKIIDRLKTHTRRPVKRSNTFFNGSRCTQGMWDELDFDDAYVVPEGGQRQAGPYLNVPRNRPPDPTRHLGLYPMWSVGDRLWVRETWNLTSTVGCGFYLDLITPDPKRPPTQMYCLHYKADSGERFTDNWRSPIHMPRWASRILLEVTRVWPERVQDISEEDAKAEGVQDKEIAVPYHPYYYASDGYRAGFHHLWDSIYAKKPEYQWAANPLVWAREFKVIEVKGE